ncbi:MAG: GNAT family N-acetyltransferase [Bacteroidia bacterium]|nr:GNAT family N-acetyltransferase [Bacteroidia bacterium]
MGYHVSTDKSLLDLRLIHNYLCNDSYWARGIPIEKVQKSIDYSYCFGVYEEGKQLGFARVISDFATFAYLADVFILPTHQGKGLGKLLVKTIMEDSQLQDLRRWLLATQDAHELYRKFGFENLPNPDTTMGILKNYP